MNSKEKARDLVHTFYYTLPNNGSQEGLNSTTSRYQESIQCALIAVDEMISQMLSLMKVFNEDRSEFEAIELDYLTKVKQEIELL
jgi:GTP cyclohydrolase I